jgi:hypothetical protein
MQDPQKAIGMGKTLARRFEERFGFDQCVSQYERLYRRAAEEPGWDRKSSPDQTGFVA